MTRKSLLLTLGLLGGLLCSLPSNAQTSSATPKESRLSGVIVDSSDRSPAIGALVECALLSDTTQRLQTAANLKGAFALSPAKSGNYRLRISFLGLQPYETTVTLG
ncbi:MAG: carboxypeptidase-like regulatory domain-containing protein, partial [Alistipes sp.]|nr:carboxypeptidase-like regulatory domain-containing protein [Alistipes sp.]